MNIILFHAGALGDFVNILPAIATLRGRFCGATITGLGREPMTLALASGLIDGAMSLEEGYFHLLFSPRPEKFPVHLRDWLQGFDLCVSWIRSPELVNNLRRFARQVEVHPGPFPPPPGIHAADHAFAALAGLKITPTVAAPRLDPPAGGWPGPRFPGIIVHPGSGSPRKNWSAEKFFDAGLRLSESSGLPLAVLCGPADRDAAEVARLLVAAGRSAAMFSRLRLVELAGLLSSVRLVLANDSGVAHLAGAVGSPVAAVFGPSDPACWGVRQKAAVNIRPSSCAPCFDQQRKCEKRDCLEKLTAAEVAEAAGKLLE